MAKKKKGRKMSNAEHKTSMKGVAFGSKKSSKAPLKTGSFGKKRPGKGRKMKTMGTGY